MYHVQVRYMYMCSSLVFVVEIMQSRKGCNVPLVGSHQANVVVHGAGLQAEEAQGGTVTRALGGKRQVFVTPLSSHSHAGAISLRGQLSEQLARGESVVIGASASPATSPVSLLARPVISKLFLKAFSKSSKKDPKTFTLRNVPTATINTCEQLKDEIRVQLQNDVVQEFDVGYFQGSTSVSIRTSHDLSEIWNDMSQGKKVSLWCDGLKQIETPVPKSQGKKRSVDLDDDSDGEILIGVRNENLQRKQKKIRQKK